MSDFIDTDLRFSIVPEWVLDAGFSDRAIRIYALIARYADNETLQAFPSRETLADRALCSLKSVDRAISELVAGGALRKQHRKNGDAYQSNLYTVRRIPENLASALSLGRDTGDARVGPGVTPPRDTGDDLTITTELEPNNLKPNNYIGEQFEQFWKIYPKKADKPKAKRAFQSALKRANFEDILEGAKRYRDDPRRDDAFTKNPQGWLSADAWENPPIAAPKTKHELVEEENRRVFAKYKNGDDFDLSLKSPDEV
jgi:hypothetical protein